MDYGGTRRFEVSHRCWIFHHVHMESSKTETESAETMTMSTETESGTGCHLQGKTNFLDDTTKNNGHAAKSGQDNVFCDTIFSFSAIDCA